MQTFRKTARPADGAAQVSRLYGKATACHGPLASWVNSAVRPLRTVTDFDFSSETCRSIGTGVAALSAQASPDSGGYTVTEYDLLRSRGFALNSSAIAFDVVGGAVGSAGLIWLLAKRFSGSLTP